MAALEFEHFIGINSVPNGVHFHPNNSNYVYSAGGNVVISDLTDTHKQDFLRRHDDTITCVSVSPSGKLIASGQQGVNSNVYVWDYESQQCKYSLEEHDHRIESVAFSHDDKLLATVGCPDDGKLLVWDMSNGYIVCSAPRLPPGTCVVIFVGFVKDIKRRDTGHYMLCTGGAEGAMLWDLDPYTGELEAIRLAGDSRSTIFRQVTSLAVSEDRETVIMATTSGDFAMINVRARRIVSHVLATKLGCSAIVVAPNAIVVGCGDGTIKCFGPYQSETDGQLLCEDQIDGSPVMSLALSADRREVMASTSHGTVVRLNLSSNQHLIVAESHTKAVVAIAFAAGVNERFASASQDGTIRVWDVTDYTVCCTARVRSNQPRGTTPTCLSFSNILLSGWSDGKVLAHDADSGQSLWFIDNAHPESVSAICLSNNNRFILTGGVHGEIRLWEMRSRELISHLKEHGQKVTALVLYPDDTQAISASRDRNILRWNLRTEKRVHCHAQRMGGINGIALAPDVSSILSVGQERKLVSWGVSEPSAIQQKILDGYAEQDEGRCVVISHSGKFVATGGTAGIVRLWDFASFQMVSEVSGHSSTINSLQFTPDDKQIVSGGEDGSIFLWCVFADDE